MSAPEPTPSDHADETIDAALPPLFWDGDGDEWLEESSPEFAALRAIVEDANRDATPREIAERCKEKGNSSVKYGVANKPREVRGGALHRGLGGGGATTTLLNGRCI